MPPRPVIFGLHARAAAGAGVSPRRGRPSPRGSVIFGAAAIRCPFATWASPSPAWLSPFLVGSAPLRRWIVTIDQPTVQIAEGHYPKSFPRRQTSTIKRLRTLLLNRGVRWVKRSHVAPPLLRCSTPEHQPLIANRCRLIQPLPPLTQIFEQCGCHDTQWAIGRSS